MRGIAGATVVLALGLATPARAEERASELAVAPADGGAGDFFGLSVSVDGDTVVMTLSQVSIREHAPCSRIVCYDTSGGYDYEHHQPR